VATLATRFGWSYEALMAMTGAERRLWLAAAERVAVARGGASAAPRSATAAPEPQRDPPPRVTTEEERRARLLELTKEFAARYKR